MKILSWFLSTCPGLNQIWVIKIHIGWLAQSPGFKILHGGIWADS